MIKLNVIRWCNAEYSVQIMQVYIYTGVGGLWAPPPLRRQTCENGHSRTQNT